MNPLIAFCGLDCAKCEARTATLHNDNALREQVARQWSEWNHVDIPAESINCLGCHAEGAKCHYCENLCPIRKCILQRGYTHCGECPEMENCAMLYAIHKNAPTAKNHLQEIDFTIRVEQPADHRAAEFLTREAFWDVYRPGCQEHFVLHSFRDRPEYIPELAFVMEKGYELIGHIMFVRATLVPIANAASGKQLPIATFGPISIAPKYQRQGYGLKLLQYTLERAREMGIGVVCMEGNIDFYKHAGFQVASHLGIHYHGEPIEDEVPYFLAQELTEGYLQGKEYIYATPHGYFAAADQPEAFAAYEATFPPKEKHVLPTQLFTE